MLTPESTAKTTPAWPAAGLSRATTGTQSNPTAPFRSRGKKFLSYYRPYLGWFFADMACALLVSAMTLLLPLGAQFITKNYLEGNVASALNHIYLLGLLMLALVGVNTLCTMFIDYQGHMMGAKMEGDVRSELFEQYQKLSFSFYDEQTTGQLMTRMTNDTLALAELYHHGPEDIVVTCLTVVGVFIILLKINVALTIMVFLFLPVMAVYALFFNRKMRGALQTCKDRIGDINARVEDTLAGIRVVKAFANEDYEMRRFAYANHRFLASRKDGYRNEAYYFGGLMGFAQLLTIAVIVFGSIAIVHASLDLADLLTYLLCVGILTDPIQKVVNFGRLYQEGITGFNRVMDILEVSPDLPEAIDAIDLPRVQGKVEFKNVTFKYRENHKYVVSDLSLEIQAGEFVALVGPSGAGKTTLYSLIPRFYDVDAGKILLDGHDIRHVTLRSLRRNIGFVQQDVYLFAGTVMDNLRYGNLDAERQDIIWAAKQANAHDFILALPDGYDTDVGQRGVKLSGGQKQRLSIARVFLKNPPLIILDEATSALDNESERAVQEALEKLAYHRTTLVIAHRLSTIRHAQRIVVLTNSGIAEQGTHAQLIALNGVYANLYNMQSITVP